MGKKGLALTLVLVVLLVLVLIATSYIALTNNEIRTVRQQADSLRAFFLAEAGVEKALYRLSKDVNYTGEQDVYLGEGVFDVSITSWPESKQIDAIGYVPNKISPTAQRQVRVKAIKPSTNPINVDAAITAVTEGKNIDIRGTADIDGVDAAGVKVPTLNMVTIGGDAEVKGKPPILEKKPPPEFEEVFGMTKEQMKTLATVYTNPKPNVPDPADGITWIDGDAKFSKNNWSGEGIIIVNGNLEITGGTFNGIIYVIGFADVSAGNAKIRGGMLIEGDGRFAGTISIKNDPNAINNIVKYYPYEIASWEEIP